MLLDTIKRHDEDKSIKLLSIEALKAVNKLPPTIHSVPALMTLPEKKLMFGKSVFDYLLLPGTGALLRMQASKVEARQQASNADPSAPSAFVLGANLSDNFSPYAEQDNNSADHVDDRVYNWSHVNEAPPSIDPAQPLQEDTRTKKSLPDIDYILQQRDMDLRADVTVNTMPPPVATRTS